MISIEEAFDFVAQHVTPLPAAQTRLADSVGRVLLEDITSDVDSPPHRKSMMDGFAIRSEDLNSGTCRLKVTETIVAGDCPTQVVETGQAARIMTGAPVPEGADAIVMIEMTESETVEQEDWVTINLDSIAAGKHLMEQGQNFRCGETTFSAGHRIRPSDIGLLAEVGAHSFKTGARPRVAFLPTGDELVPCDQQPGEGQIRNSNGPMLVAMANAIGVSTTDLGIGRDNKADLRAAIDEGLKHDMLVLSGGVSAGMLDLVPGLLAEAGVEQVFHKVKVKPGKPIWFGKLSKGDQECIVFGLPGNPVSSLVGFQMFVRTAIRIMEGDPSPSPTSIAAELSQPHQTRGNRPVYWAGCWDNDESSTRRVRPLKWNGSSDLLALGKAEGLIYFPADSNDHAAGDLVQFFPF